jgi:hypothetical protein
VHGLGLGEAEQLLDALLAADAGGLEAADTTDVGAPRSRSPTPMWTCRRGIAG